MKKSTQNQIPNPKPLASFAKLFNTRLQALNLLCYFLFLSCFLCLGVLLVSYGKTVSISLQVTQFAVSSVPIPKPSPPLKTYSEKKTSPSPPSGRAETATKTKTDSQNETGNAASIPKPSPPPPTDRAETGTTTDSEDRAETSTKTMTDSEKVTLPETATKTDSETVIPKPSPPSTDRAETATKTDSEKETGIPKPSPPPTDREDTATKTDSENETGNADSIPKPSPPPPTNRAETATKTDSENETGNAASIPKPSAPKTATKTDSENETGNSLSSPSTGTKFESENVIGIGRVLQKYPEPPREIRHGMDDEELLRMASRTPRSIEEYESVSGNLKPKVAFMFLTKGPVLLAPLWEKFFHGHEGLFSIYVHSDPAFKESEPESSVFHGRRIPSKEVQWGHVNMIEAERRLLANALLDYSNQRFVLLSESCIPLFNFETIYSYLMDTNQSFVEMLDLPGPVGRGRYTNQLRPLVTSEMWRKGSQWFQIDRYLAMEVVGDETYFPVFQKYCRQRCYSDEHYLATFVSIKFPERSANRTLTWVDWSKGEAHPSSFRREHVTYGFLGWLRGGSNCMYNGKTTNVCHLFARKFTTHALDRLVRFSPKLMQFHR